MSYSGVQPVYGTFPSDLFTGNGSNTVFTMSSVPGNDAALLVTVDGVRQHTDTYSYTANTLTFSEAPGNGAIIETVNMGSRADIIITEGVYKKTQFTATASQTNFTIATGYTVGFVDVYLNGIRLVVADDFTATDGTTIILAAAAASGDAVEVVAYGTFNVANALLKSGDTMSGNLVVSGTTTMLSPVAIANTTGNTFVIANTGAVTITGTLTASANINFDSGTFFVDGTNNRVGINNATPAAALDVSGVVKSNSYSQYGSSMYYGIGSSLSGTYAATDLAVYNGANGNTVFLTNNTERMRIDSNGYVTKPYQPAFYAHLNTLTTFNNGAIVVFNNAMFNIGSVYNTSNGRFTAPVTGLYQINYSILVDSSQGTGDLNFRVYVNGTGIPASIYNLRNVTGYQILTKSFCYTLTAGDYVTIISQNTTNVFGNSNGGADNQTSFSAYLLG